MYAVGLPLRVRNFFAPHNPYIGSGTVAITDRLVQDALREILSLYVQYVFASFLPTELLICRLRSMRHPF